MYVIHDVINAVQPGLLSYLVSAISDFLVKVAVYLVGLETRLDCGI